MPKRFREELPSGNNSSPKRLKRSESSISSSGHETDHHKPSLLSCTEAFPEQGRKDEGDLEEFRKFLLTTARHSVPQVTNATKESFGSAFKSLTPIAQSSNDNGTSATFESNSKQDRLCNRLVPTHFAKSNIGGKYNDSNHTQKQHTTSADFLSPTSVSQNSAFLPQQKAPASDASIQRATKTVSQTRASRPMTRDMYRRFLIKYGHVANTNKLTAAERAQLPIPNVPHVTPLIPSTYDPRTQTFRDRDDNKTDYRHDLASYNSLHWPDELYVLEDPAVLNPTQELRKSDLHPLQDMKRPIYGKILKDIPILPDHISSEIPVYMLEYFCRLDPRCTVEQIQKRMPPRADVKISAINMRRMRFRAACDILQWNRGCHYVSHKGAIQEKLIDKRISLTDNTTRGLSPGLTDPSLGAVSKRIPLPEKRDPDFQETCEKCLVKVKPELTGLVHFLDQPVVTRPAFLQGSTSTFTGTNNQIASNAKVSASRSVGRTSSTAASSAPFSGASSGSPTSPIIINDAGPSGKCGARSIGGYVPSLAMAQIPQAQPTVSGNSHVASAHSAPNAQWTANASPSAYSPHYSTAALQPPLNLGDNPTTWRPVLPATPHTSNPLASPLTTSTSRHGPNRGTATQNRYNPYRRPVSSRHSYGILPETVGVLGARPQEIIFKHGKAFRASNSSVVWGGRTGRNLKNSYHFSDKDVPPYGYPDPEGNGTPVAENKTRDRLDEATGRWLPLMPEWMCRSIEKMEREVRDWFEGDASGQA